MRLLLVVVIASRSFSVFAQNEKIVVATYRYADNDRIKNITPFADYLATTCGCKTEVKSYESVAAMLGGMSNGEPSIVFMNTFGYLLLRENNEQYATAVALRVAVGNKSTYQSVLVANQSTGIKTMEDLKAKSSTLSLLLVNPGSTSGNLVPRIGMAAVGMVDADQSFKSISYSKNHALTLKQVAEGKVDVGAFGSEEYTKLIKLEPTLAAKVNLVWTSPDIPLGPVVYKKDMNKKLRGCMQDVLLSLNEKNAAALESIKSGWTEAIPADRYTKISDSDYESWLKKNGNLETVMPIIKKFAN